MPLSNAAVAPRNFSSDNKSLVVLVIASLLLHIGIFAGIPLISRLMYHSETFERPHTFTLVSIPQVQPAMVAKPEIKPASAEKPKPKTATTPVPKKTKTKTVAKQEEKPKENTDDLNELLSAIPTTKVSDMSVSRDFKFNWYTQNMQSRIEENFKPPMGLTDKQDVAVKVSFVVFENGAISDVSVLQSSGIPTLDNCAVTAVKMSAPFGKLPLSFADKKLEPTVTLFYVKKQD